MILKNHLEKVHEIDKSKHKCTHCTATFVHLDYLKQHCQNIHGKNEVVFCKTCNHAFPLEAYLKRHMKTVHQKLTG